MSAVGCWLVKGRHDGHWLARCRIPLGQKDWGFSLEIGGEHYRKETQVKRGVSGLLHPLSIVYVSRVEERQ